MPFAVWWQQCERPKRAVRVARVRVEEHEVVTPLVSLEHDGVQIAHLSDIHVYFGLKPRRLWRVIELINSRKPDVVLLTGDYVCLSRGALNPLTEALQRLTIPSWATLGNHDHWAGAKAVSAALQKARVNVLENAHSSVSLRGALLHIIGIDDHGTGHSQTQVAFSGVQAEGTRLVLTHDPNVADEVIGRKAALILAGHTHGGQVRVPHLTRGIARRIGVKYLAGFFWLGDTALYVNRGMGASIPIRIAVPMEVAFLTLRSSLKGPDSKRPGG